MRSETLGEGNSLTFYEQINERKDEGGVNEVQLLSENVFEHVFYEEHLGNGYLGSLSKSASLFLE